MLDPIYRQAHNARQIEHLFRPLETYEPTVHGVRWLIDNLLPIGTLALVAGRPKVGKTCLATAMALSIATGTPFAGRATKQGAVLWIAAEESETERRWLLQSSSLADPATPLYTCHAHLPIDQPDTIDLLAQAINHYEARLIVVDPLLASMTGRSLRDSWAARRTLQPLKQFCADAGVTALVLHHQKIAHGIHAADNDQLSATASMTIAVSSTVRYTEPDADAATIRDVRLTLSGRGNWANGVVHLASHGPLDYRATEPTNLADEVGLSYTEQAILTALSEAELDSAEIIERANINESTARNAITALRRRGLIEVTRLDGCVRYYGRIKHAQENQENQENRENQENQENQENPTLNHGTATSK